MSITRRGALAASGAVLVTLAGCGGDNGDDGGDGGDTISGSEYPVVDQWLTETEVGGADDTYDGNIVDRRDLTSVSVDVGADGNGGNLAFGPSAVAVAPGTTVTWQWTGDGGTHNVVADPDDQIGETDFTFSSGDPVSDEGTTFTRTFDEAGVALYRCTPHLGQGMKGAVVVASSE
jgi:halocyanin-like protein